MCREVVRERMDKIQRMAAVCPPKSSLFQMHHSSKLWVLLLTKPAHDVPILFRARCKEWQPCAAWSTPIAEKLQTRSKLPTSPQKRYYSLCKTVVCFSLRATSFVAALLVMVFLSIFCVSMPARIPAALFLPPHWLNLSRLCNNPIPFVGQTGCTGGPSQWSYQKQ